MRRAWACALLLAASSGWGQSGTIAGTIIDKEHYRPLVGASVRVDGITRIATTDSIGRFELQGVPTGTHRLIWQHPTLDSLGLTMESVPFEVRPNDTITVSLARPTSRALFAVFCGNRPPGVIATGRITRIDSNQPIGGVTVTAAWDESGPVGRSATTDSVGRYHVCVPPAHPISIHARRDADARSYLPPSPMGSIVFADLRLGANADHAAATILGHVVSDSGASVRNAAVTVLGTRTTATTNDDGRFSLSNLPAGTQVLVVRSVGMDPFIQAVDLSAHAPGAVTVPLHRTPPTLATVNVLASAEQLADAYKRIGFTERKKNWIGRFLTQDEIRNKAGHTTSDALNGYTGIYNGENGDHGINGAVVDARESHICTLYIVDGQILGEAEDDYGAGLPPPEQVIAIEVYRQGEPKPVKASFGADACVEVLVWTRAELPQK